MQVSPTKLLVGGLVAASAGLVSAEDLQLVGTVDPLNVKVYADRDSVSRRAHLSTITLVLFADPIRNRVDKMSFVFDCDGKSYHIPDGATPSISVPFRWRKNGEQFSLSSQTVSNAFALACKRTWEFWK